MGFGRDRRGRNSHCDRGGRNRARHDDREHRTMSGHRADIDRVTQQPTQPLHNRQTKPQAAAVFVRRHIDLVKFLEDRLKLVRADADPGIPHLDPHILAIATAAHQHFAARGVFDRIAQQIAQHLVQQMRIAVDHGRTGHDRQIKIARLRNDTKFIAQPVEHVIQRKLRQPGLDHAGFDLVDVQQRIEHARHGMQCLFKPKQQIGFARAIHRLSQQAGQQRQRLQRLAQVMAGRCQKPRFGNVGAFRLKLGRLKRAGHRLGLGDVGKGDDHAFDPGVMRAVGEYPTHEPRAARGMHLAIDRRGFGQHARRIGQQIGIIGNRTQIGQRPADITGYDRKQRADRRGKEADPQPGIEEHGPDIGAVEHVLQIVRGQPLTIQRFLQLAVERGQFLVQRLQFFL